MRLHLLGLPHTITRSDYSHCAFTGKVLRFAPMMRSRGYEVVHYGVEGAESGANEQVDVITAADLDGFLGKHNPSAPGFVGDAASTDSPLYRLFNARLAVHLAAHVEPGDALCFPFGHAHEAAVRDAPANVRAAYWLETGIGYEQTFCRFKVYESEVWRAWHQGREFTQTGRCEGDDYAWVVPNYFDVSEWDLGAGEGGGCLLYFGRICDIKGLRVVVEIAKARPDLRVVLCGQGDPAPYLAASPNIAYLPPVHGRARSALLGNVLAVLCPSRYVEPFGGVAVEAMLCGTPVLTSDFGAFVETVEHGVSGWRCRTLSDWLAAVDRVRGSAWGMPERRDVRAHAERYGMDRVGAEYDRVFRQLAELGGRGWYAGA